MQPDLKEESATAA